MTEACFSLFVRGNFAPFVINVKSSLVYYAGMLSRSDSQKPVVPNFSGIVALHAFVDRSVHPEMNIMSFIHPHLVAISTADVLLWKGKGEVLVNAVELPKSNKFCD